MSIVVKTLSDSSQAQKDLKALRGSVEGIQDSVSKLTDGLQKMAAAFATITAAGAALKGLTSMSDHMKNLENKIKSVTNSTAEFKYALQGIKDVAVETRSDLDATAALFQRLAINQKEFGTTTTETLKVLKVVNQSLAISGANATEAASALTQFGQALGSGKLQGDELKSLAENAPLLLKAIGDGMGVPISQMKKFGEQGLLTTDKIIPAVLKAGKQMQDLFDNLGVTYGSAFKNLGTSLVLLKDSMSKYFLGTGDGIAKWVNDVAKSLYKLSKYFDVYMTLARLSVSYQVIKIIEFFENIWPAVKDVATKVGAVAKTLADAWMPVLQDIGNGLKDWVLVAGALIANGFKNIVNSIAGTDLVGNLINKLVSGFQSVKAAFKQFISTLFSDLGITMPTIDVSKFFVNFDSVKAMVVAWAVTLERAFFWLYDRVIGHSWIPDLVEGVEKWLKMLLGKPLGFIASFVSKGSSMFAKLGKALGLGFVISGVKKAGPAILVLGGLATALAVVANANRDLVKQAKEGDFAGAMNSLADRSKESAKKVGENFRNVSTELKENLQKKGFATTVKEWMSAGMSSLKEKMSLPNVSLKADKEDSLIKTLYKKLPESIQFPIFAAVSGAIILAFGSVFKNDNMRDVVFAVMTAFAGAMSTKLMDPGTIKESLWGLVNFLIQAVKKALDVALGGNALGNITGLFSLMAKVALLFAAGREALGKAAKGILSAPTNLGTSVGRSASIAIYEKNNKKLQTELSTLPSKLYDTQKNATAAYKDSLNGIAKTIVNGKSVADNKYLAKQLIKNKDTPIDPALRNQVEDARRLRDSMLKAIDDRANFSKTAADIQGRIDSQSKIIDQLKQQKAEATAKMKEGFVNTATGLGGVVGGVAGFQIGAELAKGMTGSPEWVKLSVTMGTAFVGQAFGAAVMNTFSNVLIGAMSVGATAAQKVWAMMPWWAQAIVAIGAALAAGYALWVGLGEEWRKRFWKGLTEAAPGSRGDGYNKLSGTNDPLLFPNGRPEADPNRKSVSTLAEAWDRDVTTPFKETVANMKEALGIQTDNVNRLVNSSNDVVKALSDNNGGVKRATGGWIRGPGSSTSDSIPALLSNGEFVVNAKQAKEHEDLLVALNAGRPLPKFARGGPIRLAGGGFADPRILRQGADGSMTSDAIIEQNKMIAQKASFELDGVLARFVTEFKKAFDNVGGFMSKALGTDTKTETPGTGNGYKEPPKSFSQRYGDMSPDGAAKAISEKLGKGGFGGVDEAAVKELMKTPEAFSKFEDLFKRYADLQEVADRNKGKMSGKMAQHEANVAAGVLYSLMAKETFKDSKVTKPAAAVDPKEMLSYAEAFRNVSNVFGELKLSTVDFVNLSTDSQTRLMQSSKDIADMYEAADAAFVAAKASGSKVDATKAADLQKKAQDAQREALDKAFDQIPDGVRKKQLYKLGNLMKDVGLTLSDDIAQSLSTLDINKLMDDKGVLGAIKKQLSNLSDVELSDEERTKIRQTVRSLFGSLKDTLDNALNSSLTTFEQLTLSANKAGVQLNRRLFNEASKSDQDAIKKMLSDMAAYNEKATKEAGTEQGKQAEANYQAELLKWEAAMKKLGTRTTLLDSFMSAFKDSFSGAINQALHGVANENRTVLLSLYDNIMNSFTNSVLDITSKAFTEAIFGDGKKLTEMIKGGAGKIMDMLGVTMPGNKEGDKLKNIPLSETLSNSWDTFKGILDTSWTNLKGIFDTSWSDLSGTFSSLFKEGGPLASLFSNFDIGKMFGGFGGGGGGSGGIDWAQLAMLFLADGGRVSGPGTATSDSIPAMLSDGEYVINAASTKKFLPLLHAINGGGLSMYADGGLVTANANIGSFKGVDMPQQVSSTSVFHLNITGDVSNQTRAEIQKMIPQIAYGVNNHNYETGRRR